MEKLSKEMNQLIVDNYNDLSYRLKKNFIQNRSKYEAYTPQESADIAISYIPSVTLEWNPSKSGQSYVDFVYHRCILRFIDEYRKHHKFLYSRERKYKAIKKIKHDIFNEFGLLSDEEFSKKVKERLNVKNKIQKRKNVKTFNFTNSEFGPMTAKQDLDLQAKELIEHIKIKTGKKFSDDSRNSYEYKTLINEYIIPKFITGCDISINSIADKSGIPVSTLSSMMKSSSVKELFMFLKE
jgi:hypothetical protein